MRELSQKKSLGLKMWWVGNNYGGCGKPQNSFNFTVHIGCVEHRFSVTAI